MKKIFSLLLATVFAFSFAACSDDDDPQTPVAPAHRISISDRGIEVKDNQVLKYTAETDILGHLVAGHDADPSFKSEKPCQLEVTVTVPQNDLDYIQWCGITRECLDLTESGVYQRVNKNMTADAMEMHAYFKKEVKTACKVKVDVKVDGKAERTFFIEYAN